MLSVIFFLCERHTWPRRPPQLDVIYIDWHDSKYMAKVTSEPLIRKWGGIEAESLTIGAVALVIFTTVLLLNGNSVSFSLLVGVALGVFTTGLRYLVLLPGT